MDFKQGHTSRSDVTLMKRLRIAEEAVRKTHGRIGRQARESGKAKKPETFERTKYVILFSTLPDDRFDADAVTQWRRPSGVFQLLCLGGGDSLCFPERKVIPSPICPAILERQKRICARF